jgi:CBS domain-containing protein
MTAPAVDRLQTPAPAADAGRDARRATLTMYSPLSAIVRRDPVTVPLEATIRETLEVMQRVRLGAIVVADATRRVPFGVFALEDLVARVVLPGVDLAQPIAAVMTGGFIALSPHASAHQALVSIARSGMRHLVVVDGEGRLVGIVSRDEIFRLDQLGTAETGDAIQAARDVEELRQAAARVRGVAERLLAQGVHVEAITQSVSTLHDLLTIRLIELTADRFDLPPVPFCWMALGSEGRLEQTFSTDQDNGLVFEAEEAIADDVRAALVLFARVVNEGLATCGFPLCPGDVMASNPRWCLTVREWQAAFSRWIGVPEPEALLNAAIFFDFRPLYGRASLADRLREWLLAAVQERPLFLSLMAQNALRCSPPLGHFRDFVCDRSKEFPHTIDLKKSGSRIFVDAARILSLGRGLPHTSTAERLRSVFDEDGGSVGAVLDGFHFIHAMRLRNQLQQRPAPGAANRVDPRRLNELERAVLKEAFRQAQHLQARLASSYRIEAW